MLELLPPPAMFAAFLAASLVLAVTPGPGVFYIVTRSLAQGRRAGLASVAGVALGNFGNAVAASLGLAAILLASSTAFVVVKYAGAAYLIWLGVKAIRGARSANIEHRTSDIELRSPRVATLDAELPAATVGPDEKRFCRAATRSRRIFRDGVVVALLNPKTAIFFAAFLPQFMTTAWPAAPQSILLGAIFVAIAATTDTVYALAAGSLGPALGRIPAMQFVGRWASGGAFIGLGVYTALSGARTAR